jgi:putative ABC transport system substrate-binding protein
MARTLMLGMVLALFGMVACSRSPAAPSEPGGKRVHLVRIDEAGPAGEQRRRRLIDRLDRVPHLDYDISTVEANVGSLEELEKALAHVPDRKGDIVLAGSALMALAATRHFHEASILFASQHDPWEAGLIASTSTQPITGFTFDANTVPQLVSILERSNVAVRRIAIVADRFLAQPWTRRADAMQRELPAYRFSVLRVDSVADLERCFASPEADEVDAWVFLGTPIALEQFERIKIELERRKRVGVYPRRVDVMAGGLMSYETREPDPYGIWARQIVLLSHGVPATQIPVEHTSRFELAINLDAAKRIGLAFPPKLIKSASLVVFEPVP